MRAVPLLAALVAALVGLAGIAGCDAISDATAPIDRTELIEDMTDQLTDGRKIVYQADYQLAGGFRGETRQRDAKTLFEYPSGLMIINGAEITRCVTDSRPVKCELRDLPPTAAAVPESYAEATKHGMITTPVLLDLLRVAALQPGAVVKPFDSTVAGLPASCLEVSGLVEAATTIFTACVTVDGVPASFSGFVNGTSIEQALVRVQRKVADDAFNLPAGAVVADLRQPASPAPIG